MAAYYNYHARVKSRINSGEIFSAEITDSYNAIAPALLIRFSDKTYPVREERFDEYFSLIKDKGVLIEDNRVRR